MSALLFALGSARRRDGRAGPLAGLVARRSFAAASAIGSALIAYALIGSAGAERAASMPDYRVSCVLGATFRALLIVRGRARAVGIAGAVAPVPLSLGWIGLEQTLSVAVTAWRRA